jgi:4-aminobutyrate aminotransferase-like enzyme
MNELKSTAPTVGDVRGRGLMLAMELTYADGTPNPELAKCILEEAEENGLILIGGGIHGNVVRVIPPLTINKEQAEEGYEILFKAVHNSM